jgi:long-chain acyl-CoA synthetase
MTPTLNDFLENAMRRHWALPAFSDYQGESYTYADVARQIERFHLFFAASGIRPGDKIALCGRNSARWAVAYLSVITYGTVVVPLLHEFLPENVQTLVTHSECRLLFATSAIFRRLDPEQMPSLEGCLILDDYHLEACRRPEFQAAHDDVDRLYAERHPADLTPSDISYYKYAPDELLLINYTSGTTAASKGVMLSERAVWSNMAFAEAALPMVHPGQEIVSLLPLAHMYGLAFELLYEFTAGIHVHFLTRQLSPRTILQAFAEIRPVIIILVPLVIEKIVRKGVFPLLQRPWMRVALRVPGLSSLIYRLIGRQLYKKLGGNFYEMIIGGAALSRDVEHFLKRAHVPFTVGYGMTECAPLIGYRDWHTFVPESCGQPVPRMQVRILSPDPQRTPGEIVTKGDNVMLGYYKNEEATRQAIDADGWLHTGDMGIMDADQNIFIKGRCKTMLLGPSGQNIYPEEVEEVVQTLPYVVESIVVQRDHKLYALIYPDYEAARHDGLHDPTAIHAAWEARRKAINAQLPAYAQLSGFELQEHEFEKTPKKSIKRFLYK